MDEPTPRVVAMGVGRTAGNDSFHRHQHGYDELCLIVDGATTIIHDGSETAAPDGTLFLFRRGEIHGFRNGPSDQPQLWVVHFQADAALYRACPTLTAGSPETRVWRLDPAQRAVYRELFLKLLAEQRHAGTPAMMAASAWLRLLVVMVARLRDATAMPSAGTAPSATTIKDAEVLALWTRIQSHDGAAASLTRALGRSVPNYDSLRHRFRAAFGVAPARMLADLRLERAKHLLLETGLSIGAIATQVGYARSHEFTRAFTQAVGSTPTAWRRAGGFAQA